MRFTLFFILLYIFVLFSCKPQKWNLLKIEGEQIGVTDSINADSEIEAFVKPYRDNIQKDLDSVLGVSADIYSKNDGELNSALGNLMADAVYEEANPIFKARTGKEIDMVLLNHGGIRSILPKGNVTKRTVFQLMPFENSIVVVALKGRQVNDLTYFLARSRRAHPISKLQLTVNQEYEITQSKIKGKDIIADSVYYVATNDYLYNGGDSMGFFKPNDSLYILNYKIRNALIDHFSKKDTLKPSKDDRFIQIH